MIIIGIDPSYTRTGLSVYKDKDNYKVMSITSKGDVSEITTAMDHAFEISKEVRRVYLENKEEDPDILVVVEYPILATRSGSYLGLITSKLDSAFRSVQAPEVIFLPSVAVKAFTRSNSKTELVQWVKQSGLVTKFNGNHDEATAIVLGEIGRKVHTKEYKKAFYSVCYEK